MCQTVSGVLDWGGAGCGWCCCWTGPAGPHGPWVYSGWRAAIPAPIPSPAPSAAPKPAPAPPWFCEAFSIASACAYWPKRFRSPTIPIEVRLSSIFSTSCGRLMFSM